MDCRICRKYPAMWVRIEADPLRATDPVEVCSTCRGAAERLLPGRYSFAPRREAPTGTEARPPIVGTDDPWSSHVAAERIEPTRGTRKAAVLATLRAASGQWVDGDRLASAAVGGSEGLRRLRELRDADGWPIERRPAPARSSTAWQYRLAVEP